MRQESLPNASIIVAVPMIICRKARQCVRAARLTLMYRFEDNVVMLRLRRRSSSFRGARVTNKSWPELGESYDNEQGDDGDVWHCTLLDPVRHGRRCKWASSA